MHYKNIIRLINMFNISFPQLLIEFNHIENKQDKVVEEYNDKSIIDKLLEDLRIIIPDEYIEYMTLAISLI